MRCTFPSPGMFVRRAGWVISCGEGKEELGSVAMFRRVPPPSPVLSSGLEPCSRSYSSESVFLKRCPNGLVHLLPFVDGPLEIVGSAARFDKLSRIFCA